MTSDSVKKRIFIVGAARSGTTLLQSMLAAHPEIYSFPETHFFTSTIPRQFIKRILKIYGKKELNKIQIFLKRINSNIKEDCLNRRYLSSKSWAGCLINVLDQISLVNGYQCWVEKTPMHLYYIPLIMSEKPDAKFIHIIRNGEDVVASLFEVSHKNPEYFGGSKSIDQCIRRWQRDIKISKRYLSDKNHSFVRYTDLVEKPREVLKQLLTKISIHYDENVLNFKEAAETLILSEERWKKNNKGNLRKGKRKFNTLFNETEKNYITRQVSQVDLSVFP